MITKTWKILLKTVRVCFPKETN